MSKVEMFVSTAGKLPRKVDLIPVGPSKRKGMSEGIAQACGAERGERNLVAPACGAGQEERNLKRSMSEILDVSRIKYKRGQYP